MRKPLNGNPPISCNDRCHKNRGSRGGTDYAVVVGTPVYAPFDGYLTQRAQHPVNGIFNTIKRPNGHTFYGMHYSRHIGGSRNVKEGEVIAYSGNTGASTGPHLHAHVEYGNTVWGMEEYLSQFAGGDEKPIGRTMQDWTVVKHVSGKDQAYHLIGGGARTLISYTAAQELIPVLKGNQGGNIGNDTSKAIDTHLAKIREQFGTEGTSSGGGVVNLAPLVEAIDETPQRTIDALRDRL